MIRAMAIFLILSVMICSSAYSQKTVEKGDFVKYAFRSSLTNGMGVNCLEDLAGKPVLVEFWGHR